MKTRVITACAISALLLLLGVVASPAATYSYDLLNRLTRVAYDDGSYHDYTYDAAGNITRVNPVGAILPDLDGDGIADATDNCPAVSNVNQADADGDTFGDACDLCPNDPAKSTAFGVCGCEVADTDTDGDGHPDCTDTFPSDPYEWLDSDNDAIGDNTDNCVMDANPTQSDCDNDALGDVCDSFSPCSSDHDGDGVVDALDQCVTGNDNVDSDGDGVADACDAYPADNSRWALSGSIFLHVSPDSAPADLAVFTINTAAAVAGGHVLLAIYHDANGNGVIDGGEWPMVFDYLADNLAGDTYSFGADGNALGQLIRTSVGGAPKFGAFAPGAYIVRVEDSERQAATAAFVVTTPENSRAMVSGNVLYAGGSLPVVDAQVVLSYPLPGNAGVHVVSFAFTDVNGDFAMPISEALPVDGTLAVLHPGYISTAPTRVRIGAAGLSGLSLDMLGADGAAVVNLTDHADGALAHPARFIATSGQFASFGIFDGTSPVKLPVTPGLSWEIAPDFVPPYYNTIGEDMTVNHAISYILTPQVGDNLVDFLAYTLRPDKIGAYYQGNWYLDINDNGAWEPGSDFHGYFGTAEMTPLVGDWSGNGDTRIAAYVNGTWYFDMNGNGLWDGVPTDRLVTAFGGATDIPVIGDWNGNGVGKIGIYRPSNFTWYLDYDGSFSYDPSSDIAQPFGFVGCIPVVGDWSGNGRDKIGVYHDGQWYLDTNGSFGWDGSPIDTMVAYFGFAGMFPLVGDWTGNGVDRIGGYYNGDWYLDTDGSSSWEPTIDKQMGPFGVTGMLPMVGNW